MIIINDKIVDIFHIISKELGIELEPDIQINLGIVDDFYKTFISNIETPRESDLEYQKLLWNFKETGERCKVMKSRGKLSMWTSKYESYYILNYDHPS